MRDHAHGVNDLSGLNVFIKDEYLLLDGLFNDLDCYAHGSIGEAVVVT